MSEMGLEKKGGWANEGPVPTVIDSGIPSAGSPGDGDLAPGPTGGGVIGANGNAPIK